MTQVNLRDVTEKYERDTQVTRDIMKDMTRQYKGMQDDLLNKINARERTIELLKDSLECQKRDHEACLQSKNSDLIAKGQMIENLKLKLDELCAQFVQMLSMATTNLKEKIHEQSQSFSYQVKPILVQMEEIQVDL